MVTNGVTVNVSSIYGALYYSIDIWSKTRYRYRKNYTSRPVLYQKQ